MEANMKRLFEVVSPKPTKKVIEDHVKEVIVNDEDKSVTIILDRKYTLNILSSSAHIWNVIDWVKKAFWEEYETILKVTGHIMRGEDKEHHEREKNIPHTIHYW